MIYQLKSNWAKQIIQTKIKDGMPICYKQKMDDDYVKI